MVMRVRSVLKVWCCPRILFSTGELPQLNDGNFLLPKEEIIMHLQTVRAAAASGGDVDSRIYAEREVLGLRLLTPVFVLVCCECRRQFHEDIDSFLTDEQRSESFAYRSMISERLHRVMVRCCVLFVVVCLP